MKSALEILSTIAAIALGGCTSAGVGGRAVTMATHYAEQAGYVADQYEVEVKRENRHEIWVLFTGKAKLPGNHFAILVDADKNTCELFVGH